jgi:small subunit ribosomal protein S19
MARSLKKGPYIDFRLDNKVQTQNDSGKKSVIKTWSRRSMISPDFVGHTFAVHNGNKFIPVYVTENLVSSHQRVTSVDTPQKKTRANDK